MIKNYYYLIVGILSILFSFTHVQNGQNNVLLIINSAGFDLTTKTTIFYVWHILTAENLIFGVAFLVMSVYKDLAKVQFTAWMIAIIMIVRWLVIFGSTLFMNKDGVTDILTDSIAIIVVVALIVLGRRKNIRFRLKTGL